MALQEFVGSWVSESGYHLRIKKVRNGRASVDFLDPRGAPVQRPYMGGAPHSANLRGLALKGAASQKPASGPQVGSPKD
jgi:hypothetical protein